MYPCLYIKYPLFLYDFNDIWNFSADFPQKMIKNASIGICDSKNIEMMQVTPAFHNFSNAHNNRMKFVEICYWICLQTFSTVLVL